MKIELPEIQDESVSSILAREDVQTALIGLFNRELEPIKSSKASLLAELKPLKELHGVIEQLGGIDSLKELAKQKPAKIVPDTEVAKVKSQFDEALRQKDEELTGIKHFFVKEKVTNEIRAALSEAAASELIVPFVEGRVRGELKDNKVEITVLTEDGVPMITKNGSAAAIKDLLEEFKGNGKFKPLFLGKGASGSGAESNAPVGGEPNPFERGSAHWNLTKQAEMYRANPEKARRMQAIAQNK